VSISACEEVVRKNLEQGRNTIRFDARDCGGRIIILVKGPNPIGKQRVRVRLRARASLQIVTAPLALIPSPLLPFKLTAGKLAPVALSGIKPVGTKLR